MPWYDDASGDNDVAHMPEGTGHKPPHDVMAGLDRKQEAVKQKEATKESTYLLSGKLAHRVHEAEKRRADRGSDESRRGYVEKEIKTPKNREANEDPYKWEGRVASRNVPASSSSPRCPEMDSTWMFLDFAAAVDALLRMPRKPETRRPC